MVAQSKMHTTEHMKTQKWGRGEEKTLGGEEVKDLRVMNGKNHVSGHWNPHN